MVGITSAVGIGRANLKSDVALVQRLLGVHTYWLRGTAPPETGKFEFLTQKAIETFQQAPGALLHSDGVVSPHGFTIRWLARPYIPRPKHRIFYPVCWGHTTGGLPLSEYSNAATVLKCDVAAIQAVARVETKEASWDAEGRPTILFERHLFRKHSHHAFDHSHPDISAKHPGGYGPLSSQYKKLYRAALLSEDAALLSTSWGMFQILGENFQACGFKTVADFVGAMMESEQGQLSAFVKFIQSNRALATSLKEHDWTRFARAYNGPSFRENDYDSNMAEAYEELAAQSHKDER